MSRRNMHDQEAGSPSPLKGCRLLAVTFLPPVFATLLCSPFQALGQWGRSKKPAGDERDQRQTGSRPHSSPARFFDRPHWPRAWNRLAPLESAEHLFFSLPSCQEWFWFNLRCFPWLLLLHQFVFVTFYLALVLNELAFVPIIFVCLSFVLKHCVWSQRNDFRVSSIRPSAVGLLVNVQARVCFHLPLLYIWHCFFRVYVLR